MRNIIKLMVTVYIAVCIMVTTSLILQCTLNPNATCKVKFVSSVGVKDE